MENPLQPSRLRRAARVLFALLAAIVASALVGSVIQTQLNLAALSELGASISPTVRAQTTLDDLIGFAPTWALVVTAAFVIAFAAAALLSRRWPRQRRWLFIAAGAFAIATALWLMKLSLGLTAVAAARSLTGVIFLSASGALGGWVFWRVRQTARR